MCFFVTVSAKRIKNNDEMKPTASILSTCDLKSDSKNEIYKQQLDYTISKSAIFKSFLIKNSSSSFFDQIV